MLREHHIGIVVANLPKALDRAIAEGCYVLKEAEEEPSQGVTVAFVLPRGGSVPLELVAPSVPNSPVRARLARGGGLDHVAYTTKDIEAELDVEISHGGKMVAPPKTASNLGCRVAFVYRRSGLLVELVEAGGWEYRGHA